MSTEELRDEFLNPDAEEPMRRGKKQLLRQYTQGSDRYVKFTEQILGQSLADVQKEILRAVTQNKRIVIVSGNGVGKSHVVACLNLAFLYTNPGASVMATSGSYVQLEDTTWKPMKGLMYEAQANYSFLPGYTLENPPRIEFDERQNQYFKAISPRKPDGLEGRHNERMLVVVDEADKPEVTDEVFESAASSITDDDDRMVVIGNPPRSESNSLYKLMDSDRYHVIQFSSFDSHNVKVDAGVADGEKIPGLVEMSVLREDWEEYNDEGFPGFEKALRVSAPYIDADGTYYFLDGEERQPNPDFREDLSEQWYRRRCGIIPPEGAMKPRPFYVDDVMTAAERTPDEFGATDTYEAFGVDIARGGKDRTVVVGIVGNRLDILANEESPGSLARNKELIRGALMNTEAPVAIDAVGEGSGVADAVSGEYNVTRFGGGENAKDDDAYYDKRTEALAEIGQWLSETGAVESSSELYDECIEAARTIEYEEKELRSSNTVKATSKDELKKSHKIGRSPDLLDAASIAVWAKNHGTISDDGAYSFYSY